MQHDPVSLKVHHKNIKTGRTERITPYRLHIEGGVRMFETPAGSGIFKYENGEPVPANLCPKLAPMQIRLTEEELRAKHDMELREKHAENEKLKAQLAAYEAEKAEALKAKTESKQPEEKIAVAVEQGQSKVINQPRKQ